MLCVMDQEHLLQEGIFTPDKKDKLTIDVVEFFQKNENNFQINYGYSLKDSCIRLNWLRIMKVFGKSHILIHLKKE